MADPQEQETIYPARPAPAAGNRSNGLANASAAPGSVPVSSRTYPTKRLAAAFAAGSLWFFAVPWAGGAFIWFGLGYILFLMILCALDYVWLKDSRHCSVSRDPITTLSIGAQNPIWLEVTHRGRRLLRVVIRDEPPLEFDVHPLTLTVDIGPDQTARKNYKSRPSKRGSYQFGNVNVRFLTGFGLLTRQQTLPSEMTVKVYPDIFQTKKQMLLARENRTVQMGLRRSRLKGQGQEFERLRDYLPDDSLRHVDWKATARRGSLITREYDVEQSQQIMVALDLGRTMASWTAEGENGLGMTKADYAINAAVLLAHVAGQSDDRVGLFCFAGEPITYVPPGKGATQASALMEALYPLHPQMEESSYFDNLTFLSRKQRKRSLIFLFTDLIDPDSSRSLISSLSLLVPKHLVVCVALSDYELPAIIDAEPLKPADMYNQTVALNIVRERKKAMAQLATLGVLTIDAAPSDLSIATVNKYLQLKREGRL